jgi:hypothetical protein
MSPITPPSPRSIGVNPAVNVISSPKILPLSSLAILIWRRVMTLMLTNQLAAPIAAQTARARKELLTRLRDYS